MGKHPACSPCPACSPHPVGPSLPPVAVPHQWGRGSERVPLLTHCHSGLKQCHGLEALLNHHSLAVLCHPIEEMHESPNAQCSLCRRRALTACFPYTWSNTAGGAGLAFLHLHNAPASPSSVLGLHPAGQEPRGFSTLGFLMGESQLLSNTVMSQQSSRAGMCAAQGPGDAPGASTAPTAYQLRNCGHVCAGST